MQREPIIRFDRPDRNKILGQARVDVEKERTSAEGDSLEFGMGFLYAGRRLDPSQVEVIMGRCKDHPRYQGKQKPRNECPQCWIIYWRLKGSK